MKTNYKLVNISWRKYDKLVKNIIKQLDGKEIDYVVPVLRGGAVVGLSIASNFTLETKYIRVKRSLTNEPNSDFGDVNIKVCEDMTDIKDKTVLICEDTIDTEYTINSVVEYIQTFAPKEILICTLYDFSKEKKYISGQKMFKHKWIVFPWERSLK